MRPHRFDQLPNTLIHVFLLLLLFLISLIIFFILIIILALLIFKFFLLALFLLLRDDHLLVFSLIHLLFAPDRSLVLFVPIFCSLASLRFDRV